MKINKIKLYNFSSYEGENVFDFSLESENKNIVLIGGKNGAGKTSLFTAIKVALYGPLAYGYVGTNSYYISKIKDLIRRSSHKNHMKGPRKRTEEDDVRFAQSFEKLIRMAKAKEGAQSGII